MRWFARLVLILLLAGCARPEPVNPALWELTGPQGERAWLFGTIHALPNRVEWRTAKVRQALDRADLLVLEIAAIDQPDQIARAFAELSHSPGLPPVADRLPPALRPTLMRVLAEEGLDPAALTGLETWAVALTIVSSSNEAGDSTNGIDRALVADRPDLPRAELEGTQGQLIIFDRLPEADQRALLAATLQDDDSKGEEVRLIRAWSRGDMAAIERETHRGMLANPALRQALFVSRNQSWQMQIERMLRDGKHPFVAVGAAHFAGEDGLPAMLARRGWSVTRIE